MRDLDPRAPGAFRRPGRDLPAHHQHHHRLPLPRLRAGRSARDAQVHELEKLELEDEDAIHLQPCLSPVWDTALAIVALSDAGLPADDPVAAEGRPLAPRSRGQGGRRLEEGLPGGRARAAGTSSTPTSGIPTPTTPPQVLTALSRVRFPGEAEDLARQGAVARGQAWMLAMQNRDGGWGAFDKDCDNEVLTFIPFADHNAMIDPSCEDITGRVLEASTALGVPRRQPGGAPRGRLPRAQAARDGTWYGRWGCNYIYGSWLALRGLLARGRGPAPAALPARPPTGSAPTRTPTAAGASCRAPTTIRRPRARALRRRRRRPGR